MSPFALPSPLLDVFSTPWLRPAIRFRIVTAVVLATVACGGHQVDLPPLPSGTTVNAMLEDGNRRLGQRDYDGGLARMRQAVEAQPENPWAHIHLANALLLRKDMSEARKALARARSLGRNVSDGDEPELRDQLRKLAFWIARDEAYLLHRDEKWGEALERYDEALGFEPDDAGVHLRKSWSLRKYAWNEKRGDPDEALEILDQALQARDRALELDPGDEEIRDELYWIQNTIGLVLKENGEHAAAVNMFEHSLAGNPDAPVVTKNYGYGLLEYAKDRDGQVRDSLLHRAKVAGAAAVRLSGDPTYSDRLFEDIASEEAGFWGSLENVGKAALGALTEIDRGTEAMSEAFGQNLLASLEEMKDEVRADVGLAPSSPLGSSTLTWEGVLQNLQDTNERISRKTAELAARNRQQLALMIEDARRREEAERQEALRRQQETQRRRREAASGNRSGGMPTMSGGPRIGPEPEEERRGAESDDRGQREAAERQRQAAERRQAEERARAEERRRAEEQRREAERRQREAAERERQRRAREEALAREKAKVDGFLQNARVLQFGVHSACHGETGSLTWQLEVQGYDRNRVTGAWFNPNGRVITPEWRSNQIVHQSGSRLSTANMPQPVGRTRYADGSATGYSPVTDERARAYSLTYDARSGNSVPVTFHWRIDRLDGSWERRSNRVSVLNGGVYTYRGEPTSSTFRCGEQQIDIVRF